MHIDSVLNTCFFASKVRFEMPLSICPGSLREQDYEDL